MFDEWPLKMIVSDYEIEFETLLQNISNICNQQWNNEAHVIEIFKIKNNLSFPVLVLDFYFIVGLLNQCHV